MKVAIYIAHLCGGLALGMALYAAHLYFLAMNLHGKATAATGIVMALGLLWPIATVALGLFRAYRKPIFQLNSWWAGIAIVLTLIISICACLLLCLLIALSGYPGYC